MGDEEIYCKDCVHLEMESRESEHKMCLNQKAWIKISNPYNFYFSKFIDFINKNNDCKEFQWK
jgi:hypothetical protein